MRIISGTYGGRRLKTPKGTYVRPTSDKIRGAIFNALQSRDVLKGAMVLDLFCGTGALGLEALSRGAAHCTFVDNNRTSLDLARENVHMVGAENDCRFLLKDALKLKERPDDVPPATLVFLDPPYKKDLVVSTLINLHNGGWLKEGAVLVVETEKGFSSEKIPEPYKILDERLYGDTKIWILKC